jgi:GNAT superfamily N-acetyltransferase
LLAAADTKLLLAENDDQIVALMDLTFRDTFFHGGRTMVIEDLVVDERLRRRGIGRQLVRHAERIAREHGCRAIEVSSSLHRTDAHGFWTSLGYEREAYQFLKPLQH